MAQIGSLPETVRIGPVDFTVVIETSLHDSEGHALRGQADSYAGVLRINAGMAADVMRATLWHEIAHVIADHGGLDLSESAIEVIGNGVCQVLRDNARL